MSKLDVHWLNQEAKRLVNKYWGLTEYPEIKVDNLTDEEWIKLEEEKNGIDSDIITCARYYGDKKYIEFNSKRNSNRTLNRIRKTLLHELCHWYLHKQNRPYGDGDIEFATELINVRAASTCNPDQAAQLTMKKAKEIRKKKMERTVFELRDHEKEIEILLRHRNKTENQFKEDIRKALIRFYNDSNSNEESDSYIGFGVEELAHMMCEWYGYTLFDLYIAGSFNFASEFDGDIGNRDSMEVHLSELGMDYEEIDQCLVKEKENSY